MPSDNASPFLRSVKSFMPRKGRPLSQRQQRLMRDFLPKVSVSLPAEGERVSLSGLLPGCDEYKGCWLEVGFGGGEHLLYQAEREPDILHIGCEPFLESFASCLGKVSARGIENVRLLQDDVLHLLPLLPEEFLARVSVLFPDPWPKKRHHKRRIIQACFLDELAVKMQSGALLRCATDIESYAEQMFCVIREHEAFSLRASALDQCYEAAPEDWVETRFQAKARLAGRGTWYIDALRKA